MVSTLTETETDTETYTKTDKNGLHIIVLKVFTLHRDLFTDIIVYV